MKKTVQIKGMVCRRCIATVKDVFMTLGFSVTQVELGQVEFDTDAPDMALEPLRKALEAEGFALLDDKQSREVARMKELVETLWDHPGTPSKPFSALLADAFNKEYSSLSALFAATEGITLEHYVIQRRIEKAKQCLLQTDLSFTEVAFQLGYSSVHHFSNQFKQVTGLTPSAYKKLPTATNQPVSVSDSLFR